MLLTINGGNKTYIPKMLRQVTFWGHLVCTPKSEGRSRIEIERLFPSSVSNMTHVNFGPLKRIVY